MTLQERQTGELIKKPLFKQYSSHVPNLCIWLYFSKDWVKICFFSANQIPLNLTSNSLADNLWARGNWRCNSEGLWLQFRMTLRICKSTDESCIELQLPGLWVSCCTVRQADGNISEAEANELPVDGSKILQGRQSPRDSQATKVSKGQPGQRVFKGDKIQGDCAPRYSPTDIPQCPACVHLTHSPPFTFKQRTEKHWLIQKH